ncbi:hypothetical protein BWQ96_10849 [Gracilariopsis chorda]|uniref:Uncharacterized protein n=1 Tax=Gracilariopsis chorda TaxID=448386 RepID=A0A2V3IBI2_9FLOR|nr:hypothetical protein BWQ96_10849 [Gracilariopsis chorda]|eukprot:PXF39464.1 hypothetical protein BWQ96_10849 [Gracilariopsis chorda]
MVALELLPALNYVGSAVTNDPFAGYWVVFYTDFIAKIAVRVLWDVYHTYGLWYICPTALGYARQLDLSFVLGSRANQETFRRLLDVIDHLSLRDLASQVAVPTRLAVPKHLASLSARYLPIEALPSPVVLYPAFWAFLLCFMAFPNVKSSEITFLGVPLLLLHLYYPARLLPRRCSDNVVLLRLRINARRQYVQRGVLPIIFLQQVAAAHQNRAHRLVFYDDRVAGCLGLA